MRSYNAEQIFSFSLARSNKPSYSKASKYDRKKIFSFAIPDSIFCKFLRSCITDIGPYSPIEVHVVKHYNSRVIQSYTQAKYRKWLAMCNSNFQWIRDKIRTILYSSQIQTVRLLAKYVFSSYKITVFQVQSLKIRTIYYIHAKYSKTKRQIK